MRRASLITALWACAALPAAAEPAFWALPGFAYLNGVGPIGGAATGGRGLWRGRADITAVGTWGAVAGGGLLVDDLPLWGGAGAWGAGYGLIAEADYVTGYGREYAERSAVRQEISAQVFALWLRRDLVPGRLRGRVDVGHSVIAFEGFKTLGGRTIPFRMADLHDINTATAGGELEVELAAPERGHSVSVAGGFRALLGRIGQSDLGLTTARLSGRHALPARWAVAYTTRLERTSILRGKSPAAVNGDCAAIADLALRAACRQLENDITAFIAANNRFGTPPGLGGARGLRAYRELRFRAAHTALSGLEVSWQPHARWPLRLVAFAEAGHAADQLDALYARSRHAVGAGVRVAVGTMPIRLEWATGQEGPAAFLTIGRPW